MQDQLNTMMETMKEKSSSKVEALIQKTDLPFSQAIMACPLPSKFKISLMEAFDKNQDPFDHLETYKALMHLHDVLEGIMCRAFPAMLKGLVRKWFKNSKPGSISSFTELSQSFTSHFINERRLLPSQYQAIQGRITEGLHLEIQ